MNLFSSARFFHGGEGTGRIFPSKTGWNKAKARASFFIVHYFPRIQEIICQNLPIHPPRNRAALDQRRPPSSRCLAAASGYNGRYILL